jgi:hypothetical protein
MNTCLEVLGDFTDEALEGELADEELRGLLVPPNLTQSDGTGAEPMGLLDTAGCAGLWEHVSQMAARAANDDDDDEEIDIYLSGLAGGLGGELFTRSLSWRKTKKKSEKHG